MGKHRDTSPYGGDHYESLRRLARETRWWCPRCKTPHISDDETYCPDCGWEEQA